MRRAWLPSFVRSLFRLPNPPATYTFSTMRIAYLSASRVPSRTANGVHVMRMCEAFRTLGHDVTLMAIPGDEPADGVMEFYGVEKPFAVSFPKHFDAPRFPGNLPLRLLVRSWDLIAGYLLADPGRFDLLYGRNLLWLGGASFRGLPFFVELHSAPKSALRRWYLGFLTRRPGFCGLIVISAALRDLCRKLLPALPRDAVFVAHDGASLPPRGAPRESAAPVPGMAPLKSPSAVTVGYVGHLYRGRGIEIIIALAERFKELRFLVVGGQEEDLARYRSANRLPNLEFCGFVPPGRLAAYYEAMDIVLAPYQRDLRTHGGDNTVDYMSPLKIFEYMAWGKAILASDFPVIREVLEDGVNALLVQPEDVDAWAERLALLVDNPEQRRALSERASRSLVERYTWSARAETIMAFVAEAAGRKGLHFAGMPDAGAAREV
ncbi:glycosyltransferase family 4 protein [Pelagibius sp.]|uniref:glycosyltransferase family 4 protein n=1 Tax=Pelagibius sp. TaxID=1931238 RepID=UPI003B50AA30